VSAVLQIEKQKPDLIFRDINISSLDEPELVNLLSHRPKIMIISSHPESIMEADYSGMKYDGYIQKPADMMKLKAAIAKL